jgi:hypothetical protein
VSASLRTRLVAGADCVDRWVAQLPDEDDQDGSRPDAGHARRAQGRQADDEDDDDDEEEDACDDSEREEELEAKGELAESDDMRSERSTSTLAEDDGTMYGKEFSEAGESSNEEVITPVLNDAAVLANQKIVSDSMNQKFIPVELRNERSSIFDIAHIDVIKHSKLNLTEAENRIRHREPHLVFELLSKASEIYRAGIISSHELDLLRSMVLARIQPSKMVRAMISSCSNRLGEMWSSNVSRCHALTLLQLTDMTMNMDSVISDHEWHCLLLKAKGESSCFGQLIASQSSVLIPSIMAFRYPPCSIYSHFS